MPEKTLNKADTKEMVRLLRAGQVDRLAELVEARLGDGVEASVILNDALLPGMRAVGEDFKHNRVYVPEVLIASRAMKNALALIEPRLGGRPAQQRGTLVMGTVAGDLHDIGKTLVAMLASSVGLRVVDLGVDVTIDAFLEAVEREKADMVGISCLLTTTLPSLSNTVAALKEYGPPNLKIVIGGAPTTQQLADDIGADGYGADAGAAMDVFSALTPKRRKA